MGSTRWQGQTDGVTSEWTLIAKVKPGQEQAVRAAGEAHVKQVRGVVEDVIVPVGTVHDYRIVLFQAGTGMYAMFMSNFDGDWGAYIDDFFATKVVAEAFDTLLSYCEGYPGPSAPVSAKKEYMQAHTVEALQYTRAYHGTVKQMWNALEVQKAFQQVLDTPGAEKVLANPVLEPLLDLAAK